MRWTERRPEAHSVLSLARTTCAVHLTDEQSLHRGTPFLSVVYVLLRLFLGTTCYTCVIV